MKQTSFRDHRAEDCPPATSKPIIIYTFFDIGSQSWCKVMLTVCFHRAVRTARPLFCANHHLQVSQYQYCSPKSCTEIIIGRLGLPARHSETNHHLYVPQYRYCSPLLLRSIRTRMISNRTVRRGTVLQNSFLQIMRKCITNWTDRGPPFIIIEDDNRPSSEDYYHSSPPRTPSDPDLSMSYLFPLHELPFPLHELPFPHSTSYLFPTSDYLKKRP